MKKSIDPSDLNKTPVDELTYEQAFSELEQLVDALESGEHTLELALLLFERGQDLIRHCADMLEKADLKIQQIVGEELIDFESE